jgi:hypothetical protein
MPDKIYDKRAVTIDDVDQRIAVVVFSSALLLVCLFWIYGYIRRRARKR